MLDPVQRVEFLPGWRLVERYRLEKDFVLAGGRGAELVALAARLARRATWVLEVRLEGRGRYVWVGVSSGSGVGEAELAAAAEIHSAALRLGASTTEGGLG